VDTVERINTTRFLGNEFLAWLWFKVELFEGTLSLGELGACEVWFDTQLVLTSLMDETEKVTLRGSAPSSSAEASEALRQGKFPSKASLRFVIGGEEYVATFTGQSFALSGIKVPQVLKEEQEEQLIERMRLIEQLSDSVSALYDEYLALRLSSVWEPAALPALREWVKGREGMTSRAYEQMLETALAERKAERKASKKRSR
jgi:hypothetical protein